MKQILSKLWDILTEIGRTRAAAAAARSGNFAESQKLMQPPSLPIK